MNVRALAFGVAFAMSAAAGSEEPSVRLYAAGSLRGAMTEVVQAFAAAGGPAVSATYGASGLLRERIEKGEPVDVFASADMGNPHALARSGRAAAPSIFTRNRLCALVAQGVDATPDTLLERMLDPHVKVGTSTPKSDPSGDYAWQLFEKADKLRPGAFKVLDAKALKLTGGPDSPTPPPDRSVYGLLLAEHKADIVLSYCTNAMQAVREVPGARMVAIPEALAVGADYGLTIVTGASAGARQFAEFVMSPPSQAIFAKYGFTAGATP